MLTVRPFNEDRSWGSKQKKVYILDENGEKINDKKKRQYKCKSVPTTDWNDRGNAPKWRKSWADMYGKEFDSYLFEGAVEETDELLEGKAVAMAEEIEVDKDLDERRR